MLLVHGNSNSKPGHQQPISSGESKYHGVKNGEGQLMVHASSRSRQADQQPISSGESKCDNDRSGDAANTEGKTCVRLFSFHAELQAGHLRDGSGAFVGGSLGGRKEDIVSVRILGGGFVGRQFGNSKEWPALHACGSVNVSQRRYFNQKMQKVSGPMGFFHSRRA